MYNDKYILEVNNNKLNYNDLLKFVKSFDKKKMHKTGGCAWNIMLAQDLIDNKECLLLIIKQNKKKDIPYISLPSFQWKNWKEHWLFFSKTFFDEYIKIEEELLKDFKKKLELLKDFRPLEKVCNLKVIVCGTGLGGTIAPIICEDIFYYFGISSTMITYYGSNVCLTHWTSLKINNIITDNSASFYHKKLPLFSYSIKKSLGNELKTEEETDKP